MHSKFWSLVLLFSWLLSAPVRGDEPVNIAAADAGPINRTVSLFGAVMLHPDKALHLHPRQPGVVRQVMKKIGDAVKAGESLARIENNVGVQTYDLVSSIGGQVVDRKVSVGQSVDESIEAFTVADTTEVLIRLIAYPRDLNTIRLGQKAQVTAGTLTTSSNVRYVAPVLDDRSRTAEVHVYVDNRDGLWSPGRNVQARIVVGEVQVPVRVPTAALTAMNGGQSAVVAKREDGLHKVAVETGLSDGRFVQILSGLKAGDSVVIDPSLIREPAEDEEHGEEDENGKEDEHEHDHD